MADLRIGLATVTFLRSIYLRDRTRLIYATTNPRRVVFSARGFFSARRGQFYGLIQFLNLAGIARAH